MAEETKSEPAWDVITGRLTSGSATERLRIEQGWLYRTIVSSANGGSQIAMVFVPEIHTNPA